jgi:transposase
VGAPARDNRLFIDAVLYRYRAGIPWRDLPERFGDFRMVHLRHMRWDCRGVWKRIFDALALESRSAWRSNDVACILHGQLAGRATTGVISLEM